MLLGLLEHVANARGADADEHFDEIGARNREKGHFGLAGDGAGQQGLAGARRADHEHTFRDLAAKFLELAGIFQEIDDFDDFLLGFLNPRHIGEGDIDLVLAQQARAALAEGHGSPAAGGALHLAHEVGPEANENQYREGRYQQLQEHRLLLGRLAAEFDPLLPAAVPIKRRLLVSGLKVTNCSPERSLAFDDFPLEGHRFDIIALHFGEELRVIDRRRLTGAHAELAENREQNDRQRDPQ